MNNKENPFNWVRICGYAVYLVAFGSYFEGIFEKSAGYLIALTVTTMIATKIILTVEDMVLKEDSN
jgi:hypothetical protein